MTSCPYSPYILMTDERTSLILEPGHVDGQMAALATTEVCDANTGLLASGDLRVLHPGFKIYGRSWAFFGPIVTLKVFEDNVLVRELLETRGDEKVLVIDGGGSMRCA
ncbi:putative 4-hydroxy-4-methyl-2-oxoglutarate aldolase 3 isoform X1 [Cinnamomum micranthum f. kanehirae]|uniref:Putative 4-hydroxy-4-methyl-2-oxoglutarate aldolase 3 isoform X1 n=1 Tax=Cinnamomum micranthum f. kanehirae TaxID=337451 RepID=A0A443P5D7_9MAGN|nr:putative 4-hydroxy-4-methyl-2-oxoglutarate aldolase 3 isoform X1 [Cinnamomum micranthum f. kanehirae]